MARRQVERPRAGEFRVPCSGKAWGWLAVLALMLAPQPAAAATIRVDDVASADRLVAEAPSSPRDRALKAWANKAVLAEILYVLRHPPEQLGEAEAMLVEAALSRAPDSRAWLRRRLIARLMLADPRRARSRWAEMARFAGEFPRHPRASAFRITALLPDSGAYEAYGSAVRIGIELGLEATRKERGLPFELNLRTTGEDDPARAVEAFDEAAASSGVMIGPLLSVPTFAVGTASRYTAIPIVSPTATDETVGEVATTVFQIGPSGFERGVTLGKEAFAGGTVRVGVLVSSDFETAPLVRGFLTIAGEMDAAVAARLTYASGSFNFENEVREIAKAGLDLLFWDGEGREAEALLRELSRQRVSVRLCGGGALAPDRHHAQTRLLLDGVLFVGDDWQVPREIADELAARDTTGADVVLALRGYLAGRMVGAAVASGALCPEEITAFLAARLGDRPYLKSLGFLDLRSIGATLPVYAVQQGRASRIDNQ